MARHGSTAGVPTASAPQPPTSPASIIARRPVAPLQSPSARVNTYTTATEVSAARAACGNDPGSFHGEIAKSTLHWYHPVQRAWLTKAEGGWTGWTADGAPCTLDGDAWCPWEIALDDGKAPFYEWFVGAKTSAAFNEVDRHVLAGHGDEMAFICAGPAAFQAGLSGESLPQACSRISRKELLVASAVCAMLLAEAGVGIGDRIVLLLPHCIEQMVWIEAAKRVGAIYTCLPESISVASLAGRIFDAQATLAITSSARSSVESTSHKALVSHAVMDYVSMDAVLRAIRRVLPEQRWRSQQGKVDIKSVCEAIESSFKGDGAVSAKEVAVKLEVIFSMQSPLRDKAEALATHLQSEVVREHAARAKTRLLLVPSPCGKAGGKAVGAPASAAAPRTMNTKPSSNGGSPPNPDGTTVRHAFMERTSSETALQLGSLVLVSDDLKAKVMPKLLSGAGVESHADLLALDDARLVAGVWQSSPPLPVESMHPKSFVYTSGSSGNKSTALVQDTGGYCSGVANTMCTCFDAVPGSDVIFVDAAPSWVTGQTYGITGPLCQRVTSVLCTGMPEHMMAQCLANVVQQLKVTIFVASASFLKRALRNSWQASWLQRQNLHEQLRVAASCGEPLSPAMHKLGMVVLCPNYINSYWASEHGSIILASAMFGNQDQPVCGDASMHALPWVDAAVWLPVGEPDEFGRVRFRLAQATSDVESSTTEQLVQVERQKGRLIVTRPWPSMARTVWGDAEGVKSIGWVGDLDTFRAHYWSTFARDDGEPVMALDLADLARPWKNGSFSVLGHAREELRLGPDEVVVAAAELESVILSASTDVIDVIIVSLPDLVERRKSRRSASIPIACVVMPENVELDEGLANTLKKACYETLGANCVPADFVQIPAIPRTHNAKPMRNVVQRLFLDAHALKDVSEIANPTCLLELKAAVDEWRFQQVTPKLDERC